MNTESESAIVLLHGAGLGSWIWEAVLPHLPTPALAIDLPGRAGEALPERRLSLEDCADHVEARMASLPAPEVTLVAHSVTGALALHLAARPDTKITSLVLVGAVVPPPGAAYVDTLPWLPRAILKTLYFFKPNGVKPPPKLLRRALCNDLDEATTEAVTARSVIEIPALFLDPADWRHLPAGTRRTYVKLLEDTSDLTPALQDRMAARLGKVETVCLKTGHLPMLSQPEEMAAVIAAGR